MSNQQSQAKLLQAEQEQVSVDEGGSDPKTLAAIFAGRNLPQRDDIFSQPNKVPRVK